MEVAIQLIQLIENLLKELMKTKKVLVPVAGALTDAATVGFTTLVGSSIGGPVGAVAGGAVGAGILGVSRALGQCNYKPLMTALTEDLTEEERNDLYERIWEKLKACGNCTLNQLKDSALMDSAVMKLKKTVEENPDLMKNIENELNETLGKKKMVLD
ncbi:protein C19orf12 homolog [Daphnia pulex]|uniref:protein C19orf12 homolog n=1 Tax=Daphnia pulex TaxID=6669 RepID=UPI001EDF95C3|nr:protein C19orf12 homolog [Daphnia pulex]